MSRILTLARWRGVTASCYCVVAFAITALTLVEFTHAIRIAESAAGRRLQAAPAFHPTLCRPDPAPSSVGHNAGPSRTT